MLISQFARRAGLSPDTVRFYIRQGLIRPQLSNKGGRNPYQIFSAEHLQAAMIIRTAQSLGMSLKEIAATADERRRGNLTPERRIDILRGQLEKLERKSHELEALLDFLRAKIAWVAGGQPGPPPVFMLPDQNRNGGDDLRNKRSLLSREIDFPHAG
jgi:DNA-binding transcriptional MerR regulator